MAYANRRPAPCRRGGFTLLELLVVIGIIVVLVSILVPVVGRVRIAAQATSSQSVIAGIVSGCDRYFQDFRAYPGPLGPDQVARGGNAALPPVNISGTQLAPPGDPAVGTNPQECITGSENLVLGLLGGLNVDKGTGEFFYDVATVGSGPMKLGPVSNVSGTYSVVNPKRYTAYVEKKNLSDGLFKWNDIRTGDTEIPEFVDSFADPMPILYMRARKGASGVVGRTSAPAALYPSQYRLDEILAYTDVHNQASGTPASIGATVNVAPTIKLHGLRHLGPFIDKTTPSADPADMKNQTDPTTKTEAMDAIVYLTNYTGVNNPGPNNTWDGVDDVTTPVNKDGYVLISAGKDRIYGTKDDITNFGEAGQ
jgi:prepilin-type N-terminal cleavage/methylation domain-containing protein